MRESHDAAIVETDDFHGRRTPSGPRCERKPLIDWGAVKAAVRSLAADNLFSFNQIIFKGLNQETKAIRCGATVHITLPNAYKAESFRAMARHITDSRAPAELFGDQPAVPIDYTVQQEAGGPTEVVSSESLAPLYDSLLVLALGKWDARLTQPQPAAAGSSLPASP